VYAVFTADATLVPAVRNTVVRDEEVLCFRFMEVDVNDVGEKERSRPQDSLFRKKLPHISSCCRKHDRVYAFTHDAYHLEDFRSRNEKPELTRSKLQVGDRMKEKVFNMQAKMRAGASHVEQTNVYTFVCGTCT